MTHQATDLVTSTGSTGSKVAVLYLRVSTREQAERDGDPEGYSLPAQQEACLRKAKSLDAIVVEEFVDRGESAKTADRPELQRLLAYVAEHPVSYVIVHKVDRLARNRADDVAINVTLQQAGAQLVSVTENIDDTPSGVLLHGIMSSIAEFYSRNLANEVMKGTLQKAKSGGTPSRAPLGYLNVRRYEHGVELRTVEVDPERAPLITWAFEAYATGDWTMRALLAELTDRGLRTLPTPKSRPKPLSPSQLHRILHHPYYTGVVRYRGVLYPGRHEAIVSEETWQKVQDVLLAKNLAGEKQREHHHYLKGTAFCGGCGSRLVINYAKNRHGEVYPYFVCIGRHQKRTDCTQKAVLIEKVEEWVAALYGDIKLTDEQVSDIQDFILKELQTFEDLSRQERDTQHRRLHQLDDERRKLLEAHYAGAVPLDLLKAEQMRLTNEITAARCRLKAVDQEFGNAECSLRQALVLARDCEDAYRAAPDSIRRKFNRTFFRMVLVNDEGLVSGELAEPFNLLLGEELRRAVVEGEAEAASDDLSNVIQNARPQERKDRHDRAVGRRVPRKAISNRLCGQGWSKNDLVALLEHLSNTSSTVLSLVNDVKRSSTWPVRVQPSGPSTSRSLQKQRRLTADKVAELVAAYEGGTTINELASAYQINRTTVLGHLRRQGVPRRHPRSLQQVDIDKAVRLYGEGTSLDSVAHELRVGSTTLRRVLKQVGVELRPRGRPRR